MTAFIPSHHPQAAAAAYHLSQQQQQQQAQGQVSQSQLPPGAAPTSAMLSQAHQQNPAAFYSAYYPAPFATMASYLNPATQQINVGMMTASMIPPGAQHVNNNPPSNAGSSSGMTTPNSSISGGPTYKPNVNPAHSTENTANPAGANNVTTKKGENSVELVSSVD